MKQQFNLFGKHEKLSKIYFSKKNFLLISINTHVPTGVSLFKVKNGKTES